MIVLLSKTHGFSGMFVPRNSFIIPACTAFIFTAVIAFKSYTLFSEDMAAAQSSFSGISSLSEEEIMSRAESYRTGRNFVQNFEKAFVLYEQAAQRGNVEAMNIVGDFLTFGTGCKRDPAAAVYWYRKAAEAGHAEAQCSLAYCYETGEGVPYDLKEAEKWYLAAAGQNHADALLLLGQFYLKESVSDPEKSDKAAIYFEKACRAGSEDGCGMYFVESKNDF